MIEHTYPILRERWFPKKGKSMYPYPTNVREEIGVLLSALTNPHAIIPKDVIQSGWVVLGFGASLVTGSGTPLTIVAADAESEGDRALLIAALKQAQTMKAGDDPGAVPWGLILTLVLQYLEKWLQR